MLCSCAGALLLPARPAPPCGSARVPTPLPSRPRRSPCDRAAAPVSAPTFARAQASDKLYTIDIRSAGGDALSSEMTAWLENNMGMKKDIDLDGDDGATTDMTTAMGLKRQETRVFSGADSPAAKELGRLDDVLMLPEMAYYLSEQPGRSQLRIHDWDIDVFDFTAKAHGSHLVVGVHQLLDDYGLISKFRLSKHRLLTYLRKIQDGYMPGNPYHNSVHAIDVALNTNYFCRQQLISDCITPLDRLAALIAASIHDFQHPGLNSNFLQATKHEYAITYNDQSILESMHVATAWKLLLQDECNFLKNLSKDQYLEFRDTVIQLVLATDMKYHFEHYTKFKTKARAPPRLARDTLSCAAVSHRDRAGGGGGGEGGARGGTPRPCARKRASPRPSTLPPAHPATTLTVLPGDACRCRATPSYRAAIARTSNSCWQWRCTPRTSPTPPSR